MAVLLGLVVLLVGGATGLASAESEETVAPALPPGLTGTSDLMVLKENPDGSLEEVWIKRVERTDVPAEQVTVADQEAKQPSPPLSTPKPSAGTETLEPAFVDLGTKIAPTDYIDKQHEAVKSWTADSAEEEATALITFTTPWTETRVASLLETFGFERVGDEDEVAGLVGAFVGRHRAARLPALGTIARHVCPRSPTACYPNMKTAAAIQRWPSSRH